MGQSVSSEETTSLETNNHVQYQLMEDLSRDTEKNSEREVLKSIQDTERVIQEGEYMYRSTTDPSQKAAVGEGLEKLRDDLRELHKMKEQSPLENLRTLTEKALTNQKVHLENLHKFNMENLTYNNKELLNADVTFLFNCCMDDAKKGMKKLHFKHSFVNSGLGKLGKGFQEIHHKYYSYYGRSCAYMNHPVMFQNFRYELVLI